MRTDSEMERELQRLQRLADLLDSALGIPGTRFSIGLDGLIGLVPGIGDSATLVAGLWLVHRAHRLGIPKRLVMRMIANVGIDAAIGAIPVAGDLFDFFWKANQRNMRLLHKHIRERP